jgi:hypothetical protein
VFELKYFYITEYIKINFTNSIVDENNFDGLDLVVLLRSKAVIVEAKYYLQFFFIIIHN